MPFVPVANTVEFELRSILDSQKVENTLYFGRGFAPTAVQMLAMANLLAGWWATEVADYTSNDVELVEVYATDLTSASGPTASYIPPSTLTGGVAVPALSNNVSLCVSFRTANRGRSYRGRNYVVGLTTDAVVQNTVQTAYLDEIQQAYDLLPSLGTATGWTWYVVSRYSGVDPTTGKPIPRVTGVRTPVTAAVIIDPTVDSQRRRLPGRGQ